MLETKVFDEIKGDYELIEVVNIPSVALSQIKEGGWKDPDTKQGYQKDNQIESQWEITCDKVWSTCQMIPVL